MRSKLTTTLLTGLLAIGAAGCSDWLTGPELSEDPNNPLPDQVGASQLFVGVQSEQSLYFMETGAYFICIWMQQCGAQNGRFLDIIGNQFSFGSSDFSAQMQALYVGGGLVDLKIVRDKVGVTGDDIYVGITKIWEALMMGEAADKWGNIPYFEAVDPVNFPAPQLTPQADVYNAVQDLLSQAIQDINTGVADGDFGPGPADLFFGGDPTSWLAVANTLKARFLLHTVEINGGAVPGNPLYSQIESFALQGIRTPGGTMAAGFFTGSSAANSNPWSQFYNSSGFGSDLTPGPAMVHYMETRPGGPDPRLTEYFDAGNDACTGLSTTRCAPTYAQPWVTYEENTLILAEAALLKPGGSVGAAQPYLDEEMAFAGFTTFPPASLQNIIEEKWVALFQNYEFWNDWKRTCFPNLIPDPNNVATWPGKIPHRWFYGDQEQNANPNIPPTGEQTANGFRNPNDPVNTSNPPTCQ